MFPGLCSNWADKLAASLIWFLHDGHYLPEHYNGFRGNLTLPNDASSPEHHRQVRRRFLQRLNRAKKKLGTVIEVFATLHITNCRSAHYDILVYGDLPEDNLREVVSEAWKASGGSRFSLRPVEAAEIQRVIKYQIKANRKAYRNLPLAIKSRTVKSTWHTSKWWQGGIDSTGQGGIDSTGQGWHD